MNVELFYCFRRLPTQGTRASSQPVSIHTILNTDLELDIPVWRTSTKTSDYQAQPAINNKRHRKKAFPKANHNHPSILAFAINVMSTALDLTINFHSRVQGMAILPLHGMLYAFPIFRFIEIKGPLQTPSGSGQRPGFDMDSSSNDRIIRIAAFSFMV